MAFSLLSSSQDCGKIDWAWGTKTETEMVEDYKRNIEWTGAVKNHRYVSLSYLKHIKCHIRSQRWKEWGLASCLRRLFTTRSDSWRKRCVHPNDISFNNVAHSRQIQEAFSGHCYDSFELGFSFSTFTVFIYFRAPDLHSLLILSHQTLLIS